MRSFLVLVVSIILLLGTATLPARADAEEVNFLDLAALMLRDGNLDRALLALEEVDLEADSLDFLRYHTLLGLTRLRRNETAAAVEAFESATQIEGAEAAVFVYLAQAYFTQERYDDVLQTLDDAGPELDRVASIYHMRAQCHWLLAQPALALATLDQASQVFPGDAGFLRRKVFFLMDLGLYREAAEQGSTYLARTEGKLEDFVGLGNAMRAGGELDQAARLLELAKLKFPTDLRVKKVLANTYLDKGQVNAAADLVLEAALFDRELVSEAAELYRRAGRLQRAMLLNGEVADQAVKLKQRLALLLELQQFAQAANMDDELRRLGLLNDQDIRYALAYAQFRSGDLEAAESQLQQLTRPDLFRKAAELRNAMADCAQDVWLCL